MYYKSVVRPMADVYAVYYNGADHYLKATILPRSRSPVPTLKVLPDDNGDWTDQAGMKTPTQPEPPSAELLEQEYQHQRDIDFREIPAERLMQYADGPSLVCQSASPAV